MQCVPVAGLKVKLDDDDAGVGLLEPFDDSDAVGLDAALDWAAELPLLVQLLGFLGERRGKWIDLRRRRGFGRVRDYDAGGGRSHGSGEGALSSGGGEGGQRDGEPPAPPDALRGDFTAAMLRGAPRAYREGSVLARGVRLRETK